MRAQLPERGVCARGERAVVRTRRVSCLWPPQHALCLHAPGSFDFGLPMSVSFRLLLRACARRAPARDSDLMLACQPPPHVTLVSRADRPGAEHLRLPSESTVRVGYPSLFFWVDCPSMLSEESAREGNPSRKGNPRRVMPYITTSRLRRMNQMPCASGISLCRTLSGFKLQATVRRKMALEALELSALGPGGQKW